MQLSDGLKQLNEEGFQKLVDAMDGDVEPLLERARALAGISGDYQTYSGLDAAMDGSVKFIYRTEAIGSVKQTTPFRTTARREQSSHRAVFCVVGSEHACTVTLFTIHQTAPACTSGLRNACPADNPCWQFSPKTTNVSHEGILH